MKLKIDFHCLFLIDRQSLHEKSGWDRDGGWAMIVGEVGERLRKIKEMRGCQWWRITLIDEESRFSKGKMTWTRWLMFLKNDSDQETSREEEKIIEIGVHDALVQAENSFRIPRMKLWFKLTKSQ
jgi:hypothetical protein